MGSHNPDNDVYTPHCIFQWAVLWGVITLITMCTLHIVTFQWAVLWGAITLITMCMTLVGTMLSVTSEYQVNTSSTLLENVPNDTLLLSSM